MTQTEAIELALAYLRVCHLCNHAGCRIKVDQAIAALKAATNEKG